MAELFTLPARATDSNGDNLSAAKLYFYLTGTTTPQSVYTTEALDTAHSNPVVADSGGKFAAIYLDPAKTYRAVLKTSDDVTTIYDLDPISNGGSVIRSVTEFSSHAVADAAGIELYIPTNITSTRATGASVVANQWGPGRVTTADGNKRGKWFSSVTAAPSATGNHDSIETAFNGDLSHSIFQIEHRITGATTLTQPTTGYVYTPEAYPFYGVLYNSSGYNHSTTGNDGRTSACFSRVSVKQYGQGDAVCYNASGFATGTKVGATNFLAQPAVVLFNGDSEAGADYVYLNNYETNSHDNGYDVAHLGIVLNATRTNATGAQGCWWGGVRVQSNGSAAWNNVISATGKFNTGIDFSMTGLDLGANKAAISLKAGDRVYLNNASSNGNYTTSFNGDYIEYSSGVSGINFVIGGTSIMQIVAGQITLVKPPKLPSTTVASLPSAATSTALEYYVTDANATTRLSTVAGGGANFVKVFSNGTNWLIA